MEQVAGRRGGMLRRIPGIGSDMGLGRNNLVIFWAMFFNEVSFGFYQTLAPLYIGSLGASPRLIGLVIGIQGLARLLFLMPAGMVADRVPLRRLIVGARALTVVGLVLYGLAHTWWQLFPAIALLAAGNIAFPAISKVIADSTDNKGRTRAFTLIYTVGPSTALLLSPSLGGVLADQVSLRSIFFAAAIAQGIAVLFFSRLQPVEAETEEQQAARGGYRKVLAYKPIVVVCGLFLAMLLVLTTGFTLVPNFLQDVHGLRIQTIGQFGSVFALGSVCLGLLISKVKAFSPPMTALILTIALCPLAFLLLISGGSTWLFAMSYFCRGGYLVSWGLIYAALGEVTPEHLRSRSFALAELLGGAGFAIAPFVAGALYEVDPAMPIYVALIASLPLLGAAIIVRRYVHQVQSAVAA
ncbi:MAG TPA: MFS transporter [Thermomicrobiales bacterium]|nr:MFS transporter [Thermomicrobiales bacterium]